MTNTTKKPTSDAEIDRAYKSLEEIRVQALEILKELKSDTYKALDIVKDLREGN